MKSDKKREGTIPFAAAAVLALAEVKAVTAAFDRGELNVFDALEAIVVAVDAQRGVERLRPKAA